MITIHIKPLSTANLTINIDEESNVGLLLKVIQKINGIPYTQQSLVFENNLLDESFTLKHYNIQNDSIIHLILKLRGMISNLNPENEDDEISNFLMNSGTEPIPSNESLLQFQHKIKACNTTNFEFIESVNLFLNSIQKQQLINITDKIYKSNKLDDIKIIFENDLYSFQNLFGNQEGIKIYNLLINVYDQKQTPCKFVLRRMQGPSSGCINFHRDGFYATKTFQMTLNDDSQYQGGRICFFTNNQLYIPKRKPGSITIHKSCVMHAVTRMIQGTRYSLFIVNKENSLGEKNVFCIHKDKIEDLKTKINVPQLNWSSEMIVNWLKNTIKIEDTEVLDNFKNIDGSKIMIMSISSIQALKISRLDAIKIFRILHVK